MTIIDERQKMHGDFYRNAMMAQELKDVMRRVQHMTDEELTEFVSAACLAMLKAWPGMQHMDWNSRMADLSSHIILPLPKENFNGEG